MKNFACDILVVGGGAAGSLIASTLARAGMTVVQACYLTALAARPYEVLGPSTRRLLAQYCIPEPKHGATSCRGLLSRWASKEPMFYDYSLMACSPALAIDRAFFQQSLLDMTREAGVTVLEQARVRREESVLQPKSKIKISLQGQEVSVTVKLIIEAAGRQPALCAPSVVQREYYDQLFAISTPFESNHYDDCLIVEAMPEGWWYIPPAINGRTQLVFLTDLDLMPRVDKQRKEWLSRIFSKSELVVSVAKTTPTFHSTTGVDARFSRSSIPMCNQWFAVGDMALSIDPLSGNGTWMALSGAALLASEIVSPFNTIHPRYSDWLIQMLAKEQTIRESVYTQASHRFPTAPFWRRRTAQPLKIS